MKLSPFTSAGCLRPFPMIATAQFGLVDLALPGGEFL
jgi:hypothetical protein